MCTSANSRLVRSMSSSSRPLQFREDFERLGVGKEATKKEIKAAYFQKAKELHPDSKQAKSSNIKFYELNESYIRLISEISQGINSYDSCMPKSEAPAGWYAGPDSRQSYFSNTRVFFRKLYMNFRISVLLYFGFLLLKKIDERRVAEGKEEKYRNLRLLFLLCLYISIDAFS